MKLSVSEIRAIPEGGAITRKFTSGKEAFSVSNTVQYVKKVYPRSDGNTYKCSTDWDKQEITVKVVAP